MTAWHEMEFVETTPVCHARKTSIHHAQLRDLIVCPEGDELFFVVDRRVDSYSLETGVSSTAVDLPFRPHALTVAMGQLVACGPAGELVVWSLFNEEMVFEGKINSSINNSCCIATPDTNHTLLVASNAHSVHTFNLDTMNHERDIVFPACMNYCAVSRDGSMMCAVGDTDKVFLRDPRNDYERIAVLDDMKGFGFGCAFDWSTRTVAAASQDGETVVWDVRKMKPLQTLYSKQNPALTAPRARQACRQVKYSPSSMVDLLVFTEHNCNFHVVDLRNLQQEQIIEVDKEHKGIAGICFNPDGSRIYVAVNNDAIYEYHVDETSRRRFAAGSLI